MNRSDGAIVAFLIFVLVVCFTLLGHLSGRYSGAEEACKSVKLEWVVDKCMKVTREAV